MKLNKFLPLLLVAQLSMGQLTTGKIEGITKDGLHKIVVDPEVRSFSGEQLQYFRIFDSKGNEVPYYSVQGKQQHSPMAFESFEMLSKTAIPHKSTSIVFANPGKVISEVTLLVANADVSKNYSISGSNDQKEWFGLINKAQLTDLDNSIATSDYKQLALPLSSYRFLKIDFDDKKTLPINILKIGKLANTTNTSLFLNINPKEISTTTIKQDKRTVVHVTFENPQFIDKISFAISAPSFYKRQLSVYKNTERKVRKRTETYTQELAALELSSDSKNQFEDLELFEKDFFIAIENRDNPPLSLGNISFGQLPLFVIADLKANEKYSIRTGDSSLGAPDYDLSYFKNSTAEKLPDARISMIRHQHTAHTVIGQHAFWQQSWFLWVCIGIAGIVILYFAVSLIKDMN